MSGLELDTWKREVQSRVECIRRGLYDGLPVSHRFRYPVPYMFYGVQRETTSEFDGRS